MAMIRGLKAWIFGLVIVLTIIVVLVIVFSAVLFLIPVFLILILLGWLFRLLRRRREPNAKGYIDVKYKVKK